MADPIAKPQHSEAEDCLHAGSMLGTPKTNPESHGRSYALVPDGAKVEYLEQPEFPPRRSGTVKLHDASSFLEYWKRQSDDDSYIYGSMQPAQFLAVFNDHTTESPGWRDHRALFQLQHSKEWMEWTKRSGQPFNGNEAFAIWLEENLLDIVEPDPAKMMDIALNFRVNQSAAFGNAVRLQDGNVNLSYTNAVDAKAGAGQIQIPETFWIEIPVWVGLDAIKYKVEARFRYRLAAGVLALRFELVRPHKVIEESFKSMLADIQEKTGTTVLFGTPE